MQVSDRLYRLIDEHQGSFGISVDGEWTSSGRKHVVLRWEIWQVEKVTPKGYWVVQTGAFWHGTKEPEPCHVSEVRYKGKRSWINPRKNSRLRLAPTLRKAAQLAVEKREHHVRFERQRYEDAQERLRALQGWAAGLDGDAPTFYNVHTEG